MTEGPRVIRPSSELLAEQIARGRAELRARAAGVAPPDAEQPAAPQPVQSSADAMAEHIRQQHAKNREALGGLTVTAEQLRALTAAKAGSVAELRATLPRREAKKRPKIHAADIPDALLPLDSAEFHRALDAAARTRESGKKHPSFSMIVTVGRRVFYLMTTGQRHTQAQIASACGCSDESVRLSLEFIEPHGLIGTLNVLVRVGKNLWRGANLYIAPRFIKTDGPRRVSRRVADTVLPWLAKYALMVGLSLRPLGLNTSPLRPHPT